MTETDPAATLLYATTLNQPLEYYANPMFQYRIVPGNADLSELPFRMSQRGTMDQMPPLATKHPDLAGVQLVRSWINALPP